MTQQHHILPVEYFGDNGAIVPLCPNCHQLYHILYDAFILNREKAQDKWALMYARHPDERLVEHAMKVVDLVERVIKGESPDILTGQIWREPGGLIHPINNN